ncbi:MAG: hypothetical protein KAS76_02640 [Thermoplasmatales archaeon]|nr:hypothetical protein [Thermoplasmatales archaeon]
MKELDISSGKKADVTEEIQKFVKKKEQDTHSTEVDYLQYANVNYMKDDKSKQEVKSLIDELVKIEGLSLKKTGGHDLSVRYKGRQLVKICPLKSRWSASIGGGKIQSYTNEQVMSGVRMMMTDPYKEISNDDDKVVIEELEQRISKMSKNSKGISTKGVKLTKQVTTWAKSNGYTVTGDTLLIN